MENYEQYTKVNRGYTMNCAGNCSFAGDYIHQSPRNPYIRTASGAWKATTATMDAADRAKLPAPAVQLVWADTRDALLPTEGAPRTAPLGLSHIDSLPWQQYSAPGTGFASCTNPGSRDQNVYSAEYTPGGLYASAPVNFRAATIPRSYPLYIENRTAQKRFYRVSINDQASASFDYTDFDSTSPNFGEPLARTSAIIIASISSVTGAVVVGPGVNTPISITVEETNAGGTLIAGGAKTTVSLNVGGADASSTETFQPAIDPVVTETKPFQLLGVDRQNGQSLFVPKGTAFPNPTPLAPNPLAPNPLAPNPLAPNPLAPNPLAPNPLAPNPFPADQDVTVYDVTDISYVVTNEGDQTAAIKVLANAIASEAERKKHVFLMLINRAVPTPGFNYAQNGDCAAVDTSQAVPISTIPTPLAPNPLAPNPLAPNPLAPNPLAPNPLAPNYPPDVSNATFYVAPVAPGQTNALAAPGAAGPGRQPQQRLARRDRNGRIRSVSMTQAPGSAPYIAARAKDVMVVTIRDILIDNTGTPLTQTTIDFKAKGEVPNHNGETFEEAAAEAGTQVPHHLTFTVQPTSTLSGATIAPPVQVAIVDTFGGIVTGSTAAVTIAIGTNPGGGTLSGTTTVNAVNGVATFSNLSISGAGNGYTLVATAAGLGSATSQAFNVTVNVNLNAQFAVLNTDFLSFGYGNMRGGRNGVAADSTGTGTIVVSGVSGPVTAAFLFWHGPTYTNDVSANSQVTFAGQPVTGTNVGLASDNNWAFLNSHSYAANVTSLVSGNASYSLNNFRKLPDGLQADINGVSLIVFFNDGNSANNRDVYLVGKNDSNTSLGPPYISESWNVTLSGINYGGANAMLEVHVADGQGFGDAGVVLTGVDAWQVVPPGANFQGTTVQNEPASVPLGSNDGGLYDIRSWAIPDTGVLQIGPNNSVTMTTGVVNDYLSLVVMLVSVPHVP